MATILSNSEHKALSTLARLKVYLNVGVDRHDTVLTQILNGVSIAIEQYCRRRFLSQTYTNEVYDGPGNESLMLDNYPVSAVSSFQYNNATDNTSDWQTFATTDYFWYEHGEIRMVNAKLLSAPKKYRATYVAGFLIDFANENDTSKHTLPADLEMACWKICGGIFNRRNADGISQTKAGDVSVMTKVEVMKDPEVKSILDFYAKLA